MNQRNTSWAAKLCGTESYLDDASRLPCQKIILLWFNP